MANYVGYCVTPNVPSDKCVKVLVPEGGLHAGQIVNLVSLAASVEGVDNNLEVYTATQPTTATLGSKFFAMIVPAGNLETLADGRRPAGQPDYTQYEYGVGEVADAVIMDKNIMFEIGVGTVTGGTVATPSTDIGKYIVPANATYTGAVSAEATAGLCLKILGTTYMPNGGLFGAGFIACYRARGEI